MWYKEGTTIMETAANFTSDIIRAVDAANGITYITTPEWVAWLRKAEPRKAITQSGYMVRSGRSRDELLVLSQKITTVQVAEFIAKNGAAPATSTAARNIVQSQSIASGDKGRHMYHPPRVAEDIRKVLEDNLSHIIWLTGPTQCGKDKVVHYVAEDLMKRKLANSC